MIVTLKDGNLWYELVCEAVDIIIEHSQSIVKVRYPLYIHIMNDVILINLESFRQCGSIYFKL